MRPSAGVGRVFGGLVLPDRAVLAVVVALAAGWPLATLVVETISPGWGVGCAGDPGEIGPSMAAIDAPAPSIGAPTGPALTTVELVGLTLAMSVPVGVVLGFLLSRTDLWGARWLLALVLATMFVPMPLHATAWLGSFGNAGRSQAIGSAPLLVGLRGAAIVHAIAAFPWVVVASILGFRGVEPELEESALMDMTAARVAATVTLRRALASIIAGALMVAVMTAGDMTVTDLLQVRTYAEEAYLQAQARGVAGAAAVAVPPTIVLTILIGLTARRLAAIDRGRSAAARLRPRIWRLGRSRVPAGLLAWLIVGNVVALPIDGLLWRAGRVGGGPGLAPHWTLAGLAATLADALGEVAAPLSKSATWAAAGASLTVAIAWPLAWLARDRGPWRVAALATSALLLAAPGPVVGLALVLTYNAAPPCLDAGLAGWAAFLARVGIYDSMAIVTLGFVLRTLPFALLILWPAARDVPREFLDAAAADGLGPRSRMLRVALPMARPAILAAWGISFVISVGELSTTNLVEPPGRTMLASKLLWSLLHTGVESHLAGVGLLLFLLLGAAGLGVAGLVGRSWKVEREEGG